MVTTIAHAAPGATDGVDLLDEPDGTAFAPGVLAKLPEVGADLAVGLSVEHGLERRGRHEQEGHAGFGGHGLGQIRLARSRWALEQDRPASRPPHVVGERLVGQEEVEGLHHFVDDHTRAAHVVEVDVDLVGPVEDVRRSPRAQQREDHHRAQDDDEQESRKVGREPRGDMGESERPTVQHRGPHHEPHGERGEDQCQAPQLALAHPLAMGPDVGGPDPHDPGLAEGLQGGGVGVGPPGVEAGGVRRQGVCIVPGSEVCRRCGRVGLGSALQHSTTAPPVPVTPHALSLAPGVIAGPASEREAQTQPHHSPRPF